MTVHAPETTAPLPEQPPVPRSHSRTTPEPLFPAWDPPPPQPRLPLGERVRTLPGRVWRGRAEDARWVRPALLGLLLATAVLYLWNLSSSGYANSFYSAAAQAGSKNWEAFFFGSSDAGNSITVDKPPAALWVMGLSVRVFGLSSWSILVPQALMGVATVGTVYAAVRRRFSAMAGLVAGAVLALTPVAVLMFRFNNPDALLALLLTVATYAMLRAHEDGRTRWLVLTGALIGFAFLTKTLQAFLVLPAFAGVYLAFGPHKLLRRIGQLGWGTLAMLLAGGWWVAIVQLVPAANRPYIGGSTDNSFLSLTFGYNGFGRLTGNETGSVGGTGGSTGQWGATGITRLFGSEIGGQISWLIPAALILLALGVWATRRAARADTARAAFLLWGGSFLFTALTFSYMSGIFHAYYTVALAPSIAALVGMGAEAVRRGRRRPGTASVGAAAIAVSAIWAFVLLNRSADFVPAVRWLVLVLGLAAAALFLGNAFVPAAVGIKRLMVAAGLAALISITAGQAAYAADTVSTGHTGSIPSAGPATGMGGMGGGMPGGGKTGGFGGGGTGGGGTPPTGTGGGTGTGTGAPGGSTSRAAGMPGGSTGGSSTVPGGTGTRTGTAPSGTERGSMGGGGGGGGLINGTTVGSAMTALLEKNASDYTWAAATVGSQNAASYQLATQDPVMAIGGFNGTDNSPTLAQFEQYAKEGKIHYFIAASTGGQGGSGATTDAASQITAWVKAHYKATTVDGTTVYDLTPATTSSSI
ncbi:glycosyltransferase family 39 protein [Streptacidiphilus carbonis]|uniref:glycosyltransferase family 39 protein n=1 Tax=Streptacidiphilus carbonis TaxID=105422 RepID=UPI0006945A52|nr:glycosyltransferase family 39 protein [Streptacidiphilus carbonis]